MSYKTNVNRNSRGFVYATSGDDSQDGQTIETAKKTIQAAINETQLLTPPPTNVSIAIVTEGQGGVYFEDIELFDSVLFEGTQTSIVTSGLVGVTAASQMSFNAQTVVSNTDNATAIFVDGLTAFGCKLSALVITGNDSIGLEVAGSNEDVFFTLSQLRMAGTDSTGIKVTGDTSTPFDFNINTVSFSAQNETFFHFNPSSANAVADVSVSSVFKTPIDPIGTKGFLVESGTVKVKAGSIEAETIADVSEGILSLICCAMGGNTIARDGGAIIYDSSGVIFGDLETIGTGTLQVRASLIIGDATNEGDMSIKCDQFTGNITNTGAMFVIIGNHVGTLTDNGTINGIINGVRYGDWRHRDIMDTLLTAVSLIDQLPTGTDTPLQITFGAAQNGPTDPVEIDALGNITINETDQYLFTFNGQYGRTGAGNVSWLFFRMLIDGAQFGDSVLAKLDNTNSDLPIRATRNINLTAGQVVTLEIVRDSQGNDSGELLTETPTLAWNASPSAAIVIERSRLQ